jgi:hypothetical protein
VAKGAARQPRLKEEAPALEGVALLTGVLSLFAFTIAASVAGVALPVASYWGGDRATTREAKMKRPYLHIKKVLGRDPTQDELSL